MSIALEHVNYIYSPGTAYEKRALNDISLEIGQGRLSGSSVIPDQENLR